MSSFPYNGRRFTIPGYWDPNELNRIKPFRHHLPEAAALELLEQDQILSSGDIEDCGLPKILVVDVDLTNCFVLTPDALQAPEDDCLSVPGAVASAERAVRMIYEYAPYIWRYVSIVDTHPPLTVHSRFWYVDTRTGKPPRANSPIFVSDLESGAIKPVFDGFEDMGLMPPLEYAKNLSDTYGPNSPNPRPWDSVIMAWATHSQEASTDNCIITDLREAMHYWSILMKANPYIQTKGLVVDSENYGAFECAVPTNNPASSFNMDLLEQFLEADWIFWRAQARTHCSVDSASQLVAALEQHAPQLLKRLVILEDCHDNIPDIVEPGTGKVILPFKQWADDAFAKMAEKGVRFMRTTDPEFHQIMTG